MPTSSLITTHTRKRTRTHTHTPHIASAAKAKFAFFNVPKKKKNKWRIKNNPHIHVSCSLSVYSSLHLFLRSLASLYCSVMVTFAVMADIARPLQYSAFTSIFALSSLPVHLHTARPRFYPPLWKGPLRGINLFDVVCFIVQLWHQRAGIPERTVIRGIMGTTRGREATLKKP